MTIAELDYYAAPRHIPFRRSLAILKRLRVGDATRSELLIAVAAFVDNAYTGSPKARRRLFEGDIQRLRELGARIEYENKTYRLIDCGDLLC